MSALKLVTSNATHALLAELVRLFRESHGVAVEIEADSAKVMLERLRAGEAADVAVLNAAHLDDLVAVGRIDAASRRLFARSRVGVAVRAGTPHPTVDTVEALRRALLDAGTIAHTVHGASGMYVPTLLERLGIADRVRTVTRPGGLIGRVVAAGEAAIAIQQIAELLAVEGVELVGPLPDEVQMVNESAVGIFGGCRERAVAQALLEFFLRPECAPIFAAHGLERGT